MKEMVPMDFFPETIGRSQLDPSDFFLNTSIFPKPNKSGFIRLTFVTFLKKLTNQVRSYKPTIT